MGNPHTLLPRAEIDRALLIAGQLAGIAFDLDADALEKWLDSKPEDFRYEEMCRAAITFKRALGAKTL